ncbi:MAG: TonB-dependent receptor [Pseudomonadales bacterium]|nr:TonB-dependent receptor [Pseudomonadales bacterium]
MKGLRWLSVSCAALAMCAPASALTAEAYEEEVVVVAPTPAGGVAVSETQLVHGVQVLEADALRRSQAQDLTEALAGRLAGVSLNAAQNNPLQPDLLYRGFTASPLLGLAQGLAVYQGGVRVNDPLGDAVRWELIPESAVSRVALAGGSNPLFGLNALGGALLVEMKDGFSAPEHSAEVTAGSWARRTITLESGGNNGTWGYYLNGHRFEEDGWRDLSPSETRGVYASIGYRPADTSVDLSVQADDTDLTGNGAAPVGLLAIDRKAVFTAPDITRNKLRMVSLRASRYLADDLQLSANAHARRVRTRSFNGDASPFTLCRLAAGQFLVEGLEDDALAVSGLDEDDVCDDNVLQVDDPQMLEATLNALVGGARFALDDVTDSLTGSGRLEDDAINNISRLRQTSRGVDVQADWLSPVAGRPNRLIVGAGWILGESRFASLLELAALDPVTRSTANLGTGTFVGDEAVDVATRTRTWSAYLQDSLELTDRLTLTAGGRYVDVRTTLRDRSSARPELDGDHRFRRFNAVAGLAWRAWGEATVYGSVGRSSRTPTPIELACNEGVFERARTLAPDQDDEVKFECRLPNAFLADPPLEDVVSTSIEAGLRADAGTVHLRLGLFHIANRNDILFQTTGRATGLFANVKATRRMGVEASLDGESGRLAWRLQYSYVDARFRDAFTVLSPNHPLADDRGELRVPRGRRIPGIPAHQLRLSAEHSFGSGLQLGADLLAGSGQRLRGDEINALPQVHGYALVNLRAAYTWREKLTLFLKVTNCFDVQGESFGLLGERPDEVLPGLVDARPYYLGALPGRGVHAGLRYRL